MLHETILLVLVEDRKIVHGKNSFQKFDRQIGRILQAYDIGSCDHKNTCYSEFKNVLYCACSIGSCYNLFISQYNTARYDKSKRKINEKSVQCKEIFVISFINN